MRYELPQLGGAELRAARARSAAASPNARARRARQVAERGAARPGDPDETDWTDWHCASCSSCSLWPAASRASAQVTRLEITSREPMNDGAAGRRRRAVRDRSAARIHGEVDPKDRTTHHPGLALAPRNARGTVEYVATFALAKPVDPAKASRRAASTGGQPRQRRRPTASAEGDISLVSGWQGDVDADRRQPDDRRAGRAASRTARRSPGRCSRASSTSATAHDDAADPPRLASATAAGVSAGRSRAAGRDADVAHGSETSRRRAADVARRCRAPTGRSPTAAATPCPGHARSDAHLPEGRLRSGAALRARLHREGSAGARRRPRRHARHRRRSSATPRADARARRIRSPARSTTPSAIGDSQSGNFIRTFIHLGFNQDADGPHRLGRRLSAHRGAADADQRPLRAAGRRRRRCTSRAARRRLVGRATRTRRAAPTARRPARSLHRDADLPEDHRGVRIGRVLGPAHVAGSDRHRRHAPTFRCRPTCAATTIPARRTAADAAASPSSAAAAAGRAARCRRTRTRRPRRRAR